MSASEKEAATQWTIEHLVITRYTIHSHITVDSAGPNPNYISHSIVMLEGAASAPYTITGVQIKFVPDGQPLAKPSWQAPNLSCEKHRSEYAAIMDMINKGIDFKKPTSEFSANYIGEPTGLVLIVT